MKVLVVLNWLGLGGIETGLLKAIPLLQKKGVQLDVCCTGPRNTLDSDFEALGCQILRIPKTPNCLKTAKHLREVLEQDSYSLVHSQFGFTSGGIALGASKADVPCIVSIHSCEPLTLYRWKRNPVLSTVRKLWLKWHRMLMDRYVTYFIGHSETNVTAFNPQWHTDEQRYGVIYNGIECPSEAITTKQEARQELGLAHQESVVLHVGSFKPEKNHLGLLEIFRRVLKQKPDSRLVMVGDGTTRGKVESKAQELGISERLRFEGARKNVWSYYHAADLFVFPSITEGFGNALVESALAKLPIVASDLSAHRESVGKSQQRFLFSLPDYATAADLAIAQLEAARENRNPWVAECKTESCVEFSIENFANDLADKYRTVARKAA